MIKPVLLWSDALIFLLVMSLFIQVYLFGLVQYQMC